MRDAYNTAATEFARLLQEANPSVNKDRPREALFPQNNRPGYGVALEYERMGNRPISADLESRAAKFGIEFEHLGTTLGSVLHNVDLKAPLGADLIQVLRDSLLERKVIFFRDQHLSEDEQVAFGRCFGALDPFPFGKPGTNPYILEIVHGAQSPGTENRFHTDVTWMERPSLGSIAQCVVVPPIGGDTLFSDSHAAYLGLSDAVRSQINNLDGVNDYRLFLQGRAKKLPEAAIEALKNEIPYGVRHPLARTHPETGKTALYIHGGFLRHESLQNRHTGELLAPEAARALVAELLAQHPRPEYCCRFKWSEGAVAFWDNRAVQHYAASDYYPHRRVLRRVTVSGDVPFYREPDAVVA